MAASPELVILTKYGSGLDDGERPDGAAITNHRVYLHNGGRMDRHSHGVNCPMIKCPLQGARVTAALGT